MRNTALYWVGGVDQPYIFFIIVSYRLGLTLIPFYMKE